MLSNRNLQKQDIASFCCSKGLFHEISLLNKFDFGREKKNKVWEWEAALGHTDWKPVRLFSRT